MKSTIPPMVLGLVIILFFSLPSQCQAQVNDRDLSEEYSREELAQMLAPIALYPDALLSQVLMASTYPVEVIEADRWVRKNSRLTGEALDEALLDKDWDPSVKAMCHFPSILALMSDRISETSRLGDAFLGQETEVMGMVQELRARAYAQGNLTTTSKQKVIVEKETIVIQPANPRVVYVPYYDPLYIYGSWWYPAYRPCYWGPARVRVGIGISYWPGFYFGFSFGNWSYFDWHGRHICIDVQKRPRYVRRWISKPGRWYHAPRHRRGVVYRNRSVAGKYGHKLHRSENFRRNIHRFPERRDRHRVVNRPARDPNPIASHKGDKDRSRIERHRRQEERGDGDRKIGRPAHRKEYARRPFQAEHAKGRPHNLFSRAEGGRRGHRSAGRR